MLGIGFFVFFGLDDKYCVVFCGYVEWVIGGGNGVGFYVGG